MIRGGDQLTDFFASFSVLMLYGLLCACVGPFVFIGPLVGFPIVGMSAALGALAFSLNYSKIEVGQALAFPVAVVILTSLFAKGLDMIVVGMIFQSLGILIYCISSPFLLEKLFKK